MKTKNKQKKESIRIVKTILKSKKFSFDQGLIFLGTQIQS